MSKIDDEAPNSASSRAFLQSDGDFAVEKKIAYKRF
jgi:hypothetical protein